MKKTVFAFSILAFAVAVTSCSDAEEKKKEEKKVVRTKNPGIIIGDPMDCGLDSLTIFPVGCSYKPQVIEPPEEESPAGEVIVWNNQSSASTVAFSMNDMSMAYDKNAKVEFVNGNSEDFDIRNILFYNMQTGRSYPLIEDSAHILSFAIHKEFELPLIFYRVVLEDYNGDEKYNSLDPVMLYVSHLDGSNFTQITPPEEYFIDYTLYAENNTILIKTAIDSDKNNQFLTDDETNFRSMKLNDPKPAENIFDEDIKNTLRKFN